MSRSHVTIRDPQRAVIDRKESSPSDQTESFGNGVVGRALLALVLIGVIALGVSFSMVPRAEARPASWHRGVATYYAKVA